MDSSDNFLALDVGSRRIGVAIAGVEARLPAPLTTLTQDNKIKAVLDLVRKHTVVAVIVGLPRSLDGRDSAQTEEVEHFVELLKKELNIPIYLQDEAVTSIRAEEELNSRKKPYKKEDIDALSATYILDDFLNQQSPRDKLERSL